MKRISLVATERVKLTNTLKVKCTVEWMKEAHRWHSLYRFMSCFLFLHLLSSHLVSQVTSERMISARAFIALPCGHGWTFVLTSCTYSLSLTSDILSPFFSFSCILLTMRLHRVLHLQLISLRSLSLSSLLDVCTSTDNTIVKHFISYIYENTRIQSTI